MLKRPTSLAILVFSAFSAATALAQQPPPLPGVTYSPAPGASTAAPTPAQTPTATADPHRGIVALQRDGHTIDIGTVLNGDGRILTSLAPFGASDKVDIKYADGHVVHGKLVHQDRAWDLALVVPLSGKWTEGLAASEADPGASELRVFVGGGNGTTQSITAHVHARVLAHAKDGTQLPNAFELDLKTPPTPGASIVDVSGNVVGVYIRACRPGAPQPYSATPPPVDPNAPCTQMFYGAPVAALRAFLSRTPANAVAPSPWLGIVGTADTEGSTHGVRVMAVAPGSPAEKGGLKANPADKSKSHLIVAVDSKPVDSPDALASAISSHSIGDKVKVMVLDGGKLKELEVLLRAAP